MAAQQKRQSPTAKGTKKSQSGNKEIQNRQSRKKSTVAKKVSKSAARIADREASQSWQSEFQDGEQQPEPARPPSPPSPPPWRLASRPGEVNVAAVHSEGWHLKPPANRQHAAYIAGRLWHAIRWLQALCAFLDRRSDSIILEIERIQPHLTRATEHFMSPETQGSVWPELFENWRQWRQGERYLGFIEGLFFNLDGRREPDPADLEPDEIDCFRLFRIDLDGTDKQTTGAIRLGIEIDQALRPWRNGIQVSQRLGNPWISESAPCADVAWLERVRVFSRDVVDAESLGSDRNHVHFHDVQTIDDDIRRTLSAPPLADNEKRRLFGLILNSEGKTIRRETLGIDPIHLKKRNPIVDALSGSKYAIPHARMQRVYEDAEYKGRYAGSAFSELVGKINGDLVRLGVQIESVPGVGWRLVENKMPSAPGQQDVRVGSPKN